MSALDRSVARRQNHPMAVGAARSAPGWLGLTLALASVAATAVASLLLVSVLNLASLALLFIVPVMFAAARAGLWSGLMAAASAALAFNFLLVEPRFTLRIADPDNVATTSLLFLVAAVISHFAGQLRAARVRAERAMQDERVLAQLTQEVADQDQQLVIHRLCSLLADRLGIKSEAVATDASFAQAGSLDHAAASWALTQGEAAGLGTGAIAGADRMFVPVIRNRSVAALISLTKTDGTVPVPADRRRFLQSAVAIAEQALARAALRTEQAELEAARQRHALGSALLSSVGHDLRTPLTVILGEARALAAADPVGAGPAAIIEEAERLRRRIDNLLGMARIQGGDVTVASEPIDLADAVASALDDAAPAIGQRRATITLPHDLPLVRADPGLLHHVLLNLIDNAAKFSSGPIEIEGASVPEGVELTISDHGPGLPVGREHEAFDRFQRFAGSDRTGGTGLGLAIAKAFSHAFGADITVANRDGGGAAFSIRFP